MGVEKNTLFPGNGSVSPLKGDIVSFHYTSYLYDASQSDNYFKGKVFDSSHEREPLRAPIGIGVLIPGWEQGICSMKIGEKAILTISPDLGYNARDFPDRIPANTHQVFEIDLLRINTLTAPRYPQVLQV